MEENTNNATTDTMMTSTPEQRNEAEAIFRFMSKLKANKPGAKLEEQLDTLDSFFTADETSFNIEELDPYVVAFIEKICKDFCDKNKESLSVPEGENPIGVVVALVMRSLIIKGVDSKPTEEVYKLYQKYLDDYIEYVEGIIENENKYELTINSEGVYKRYLQFKKDLNESEKNRTIAQAAITLPEYVDNNLKAIKDLREAGLDSKTVSRLISEVLLQRYVLVAMQLTTEPLIKLGPVEGMSDAASIHKFIAGGERMMNELELTDTQIKLVKQASERLQYLIPKNTSSSGCLGVFFAIIGISASVLAAIGYGISKLFA